MPWVGSATNKKFCDSRFCRRFDSWIDQEIHAVAFRQQANTRANSPLIEPGMVLSMLQIRDIRPEWLIDCGFCGDARTVLDESGRKCPVSDQYKI
jgi:hypothetical protein